MFIFYHIPIVQRNEWEKTFPSREFCVCAMFTTYYGDYFNIGNILSKVSWWFFTKTKITVAFLISTLESWEIDNAYSTLFDSIQK